jgi:hypothetical protein
MRLVLNTGIIVAAIRSSNGLAVQLALAAVDGEVAKNAELAAASNARPSRPTAHGVPATTQNAN